MSSALNLLRSFGTDSKPYIGFTRLPHGYHEIERFRLVLEEVLLVELKDQVLFLPSYFAVSFQGNHERVEELNSDGIKKFLFFGGKRSKNK